MITNSRALLAKARAEGFAIGAFNTSNLEITKAIIVAAEAKNAPVIIQTSKKALEYAGFDELMTVVRVCAEGANVPVVIHADHIANPEYLAMIIKRKLHSSVMFDGSKLPFSDNVEMTRKLTRLAHSAGLTLEAELGNVGSEEDYRQGIVRYTDPDQAKEFAQRTHCDSLAIAIGNIHGPRLAGEKLNLKLLKTIAGKVSIPLVLHGASNSTRREIKAVIESGIAKINIDTELRQAFVLALRRFLKTNPTAYDPREILTPATEAVKRVVQKRIIDFSSQNKGKIAWQRREIN